MNNALSQYYEKRTTMAESIKPDNQHEYPVLIFCPEPGFKPSFFKEIKNKEEYLGIQKYIWKFAIHKKLLLKNVLSIPEVYKNMSYILGEDWGILLLSNTLMDSVKVPVGTNFEFKFLKVGTHEYFGQIIEATPIKTTLALCYKVESKSKFRDDTSVIFTVRNKKGLKVDDKLKSMKLYVAAKNSWQGVIYGTWPNTKNPLKVIGKFTSESNNFYDVPIEVTERSHLMGNGNYSQCIDQTEFNGQSCKSIFHPNSHKYENKFVS